MLKTSKSMADISSITSLITSFRSETREEAITPEVLGALLQKIADLLGKAALQTDVSRLDNWRSDLARIGYVLTSLSIGSDDRNNVYFTLGKANHSHPPSHYRTCRCHACAAGAGLEQVQG